MYAKAILPEILENLEAVVAHDSPLADSLLAALAEVHPADIAQFLGYISRGQAYTLFGVLQKPLQLEVFRELSDTMKVLILACMDDTDKVDALHVLPIDKLTDLFDHFSDEELRVYLNLLHKKEREKVLSLLKFHPESAGGIMDVDVLTLMEDYTVAKSITLLQRLRPNSEIHQQIYVINRAHRLVGFINLQDLVLQKPDARISSFMQENKFVAPVHQDQEQVAKKMVHYNLMMVPVVDDDNHFLGVIPSETLVDVIVEEASEDVQKMAAMTPMKDSYFQTSFFRLFYERSYILVALLLAESFSGTILRAYEATLSALLISFIPMLISAGGNTSNQTSAMVIQGMAAGDITFANMRRFLRRELFMSALLAIVLGLTSFARVYATSGQFMESVAVSLSLSLIVLASAILGSCIPLLLKRINIDPAFSDGPFLATLMDILGVLIFCYVSKLMLC